MNCKNCESKEFIYEQKGQHVGMYCANCGKWQKWMQQNNPIIEMPFGKYKDRYIIDLPEYYVVWYHNKGFPKGKLGDLLQTVYELKLNGLEDLIRNIKKQYPK